MYSCPAVCEDSGVLTKMRSAKEIITELFAARKATGVEPASVQLQEFIKVVIKEAKEELWELVKNKEVTYHQTLNGHSFSIPDKKKDNSDDSEQGRT